jgi:hypothetical protein
MFSTSQFVNKAQNQHNQWEILEIICRFLSACKSKRRSTRLARVRARVSARSCWMQTRRCGTRLHWIGGHGHLKLEGLTAQATKNTRSNPLSVPFSELSFHLDQGDLSKIDMRMDLSSFCNHGSLSFWENVIRLNSVNWNLMLIFNIILI